MSLGYGTAMNRLVRLSELPAVSRLRALFHRFCPRWEVTRRLEGLRCRVNVNDHLMWLCLPAAECLEAGSYRVMNQSWGTVWDVGANFGFFALVAARKGNRTIAFDLSPYVLGLLEQSCKLNQLEVTTIPRALTVEPVTYTAPETGSCKNRVGDEPGASRSLSYVEAAAQFGTPNLIKMDIEGGERAFFESEAFRAWVLHNRISWLVEIHDRYKPDFELWKAANPSDLDSRHVFFDLRKG